MLQYFRLICPLLIGAEGTRLLRDREVTGDPTGAKAPRRLQEPPRGKRVPGAEINRPVSKDNLLIKISILGLTK